MATLLEVAAIVIVVPVLTGALFFRDQRLADGSEIPCAHGPVTVHYDHNLRMGDMWLSDSKWSKESAPSMLEADGLAMLRESSHDVYMSGPLGYWKLSL